MSSLNLILMLSQPENFSRKLYIKFSNIFMKNLCFLYGLCFAYDNVSLNIKLEAVFFLPTLVSVLVRAYISGQNIMTKKQGGEKRVYSAYSSTLLFITEGSQDWNSSRAGSSSWCRGHGGMFLTGLLALACSACFLIEPKTTSPEMVPPTRGPPHLITNGENAPQLDLMEAFPQLKLLSLS